MSAPLSTPPYPPLRLTSADFDAYRPNRAVSDSSARQRLELKQRMDAWAPRIVKRLDSLSISADVRCSDEHPNVRNKGRVDCQRLLFWLRGTEERRPTFEKKRRLSASVDDASDKNQSFLAIQVDSTGVWASLEVHPHARQEVKALKARINDPAGAEALLDVLHRLPNQFVIGLTGETDGVAADRISTAAMSELLERSRTSGNALRIGWHVPREIAVTHADDLDDLLVDAIVALVPLYQLIGSAAHSDSVEVAAPVDAMRQGHSPSHEIEKGARVHVLSGPFAGKTGVVQELDGKGGGRVLLGLLAMQIDLDNLAVDTLDRPVFSSSHRRPLGDR